MERRFDDSMSSTSSSKYMILLLYLQSILSCTLNLIMMTWSRRNVVLFYNAYIYSKAYRVPYRDMFGQQTGFPKSGDCQQTFPYPPPSLAFCSCATVC